MIKNRGEIFRPLCQLLIIVGEKHTLNVHHRIIERFVLIVNPFVMRYIVGELVVIGGSYFPHQCKGRI